MTTNMRSSLLQVHLAREHAAIVNREGCTILKSVSQDAAGLLCLFQTVVVPEHE